MALPASFIWRCQMTPKVVEQPKTAAHLSIAPNLNRGVGYRPERGPARHAFTAAVYPGLLEGDARISAPLANTFAAPYPCRRQRCSAAKRSATAAGAVLALEKRGYTINGGERGEIQVKVLGEACR
jgi:hypothetical protein